MLVSIVKHSLRLTATALRLGGGALDVTADTLERIAAGDSNPEPEPEREPKPARPVEAAPVQAAPVHPVPSGEPPAPATRSRAQISNPKAAKRVRARQGG
jgi:hypothetical protein